jgi:hypothetical protein
VTEPIRYRVGVDENGLGPALGPMIVTAVLARVSEAGAKVAGRAARGALASRLGDSKDMVSHGDVALGEAWARALVARGCGREPSERDPAGPDALVHAIARVDRSELRAPCPAHVEAQCWSRVDGPFEADDELVATVARDLERLADKGVEVVAVRSEILCVRRMNDAADAGASRFTLDLHAMERLVLDLGALAGAEVHAVCGKVGGFGKYSSAFGPLAGRLHTVVEERRARSVYHFPGVGELAFVMDGDASDLVVGMASMVGKYVREALMGGIVRYYQALAPAAPTASGYNDPVTKRFIEATRLVRGERGLPDACFERRRVARD